MSFTSDIEGRIRETLEHVRSLIEANISANGLTASGNTARSMQTEMYDGGGKLTGRAAFGTLETGRRPGKVPQDITEILKQWALDKGINITQVPYKRQPSANWQPKYSVEERSLEMFAQAVAHTIKTKGTKLYREGGDPNVYTPVIDEVIEKLRGEIFQIITDNIKNTK